jgi:hypothetical protein
MRVLWLSVLISGVAMAIEPGGTMYVKPVETVLLKAPKKGAAKVAKLQSNDAVVWNGSSKEDPNFHSVTTSSGKKGFIRADELSETEIPFAQQGYTKGTY